LFFYLSNFYAFNLHYRIFSTKSQWIFYQCHLCMLMHPNICLIFSFPLIYRKTQWSTPNEITEPFPLTGTDVIFGVSGLNCIEQLFLVGHNIYKHAIGMYTATGKVTTKVDVNHGVAHQEAPHLACLYNLVTLDTEKHFRVAFCYLYLLSLALEMAQHMIV
ncbi:hypothetical protein ACJX0J_019460, partial [Zea mays]